MMSIYHWKAGTGIFFVSLQIMLLKLFHHIGNAIIKMLTPGDNVISI